MRTRITALVAATLAVSVPATAADIYVPTADPAPLISGVPVYDWSGLHIGIGAGTVMSNNYVSAPAVGGGATFGGLGGRGFVGSLNAGYDYALSNGLVVGGAITGRYGDVDASWAAALPTTGEITADYGFDVVGRLGYAITPHTLAYVLGGYSWQHFKLSGTSPAVSNKWGSSGYVFGIGTETAIRNNWTLSSEYRYANYGSESIPAYAGRIEPVLHSFNTTLNYRFNGGPSGQSMAPVVYDWTGVKVGGSLGLGVALSKFTTGGGASVFDAFSNEAFLADVNVGYDREFGQVWLGGVVLAAGYDGGRSRATAGGTVATAKTESFGFDVMLRGGRKFNDYTMGYLIGGYSWQKMTGTFAGVSNNTGVSGYTIGTGTEFALSEKLTAFVEYRYSGYQDFNITPTVTVDPSDHSVRVGAKWKLY